MAVPVALAATLASLSLASLPWIALLAVGVCLTGVAFHRGRIVALIGSAQMAFLFVLLSLPTFAASVKLLPSVKGTGPLELGNLALPMPAISAAGVWITGDYRYPQDAHRKFSEMIAVLVLVLAAVGLAHAIRRRRWSVAWLAIAGAVSLFYVAHRYGPWIQFKADCVTAPISLLLAFSGIGALMRIGPARLPLGVLPAAVVGLGVLAGSALLYHNITLAPYERLHNLEEIGERFAGQGPTLTPDFEEYAEYYLRDDDQTSMVNGPTLGLLPGVNRATEPGGIYNYDLNEFALSWLESFRTIVMRRDPVSSRPPSNYRLVYLSTYYEVWQRTGPVQSVLEHVPLTPGARAASVCNGVEAAARRAGTGTEIAYTTPPRGVAQFGSGDMTLSSTFQPAGGPVLATGAGHAVGEQPVPSTGNI